MLFNKTAFITGVTGQDGSLLAEFLLGMGYDVHGLRLYSATDDTQRLTGLLNNPRFHLHYGDLADAGNLWRLLSHIRPGEIYNLAAVSHVKVSFDVPEAAAQINALGTLRILDAMRGLALPCRFYQASSSEMFGNAPAPQDEETRLRPCSPYAAAKVYAFDMTRIYRDSYGIHASNGILFNHESPVRGEHFVTRKVTRAAAAIAAGMQDTLMLGNLDARRDWGHARDYVRGMWMMLQQERPDDYVLATGQSHSVRDFVNAAFDSIGVALEWRGEGLAEKGIERVSGKTRVAVDPQFFRPNEVHELRGNPAKARRVLGWQPEISFEDMVREMVQTDKTEMANEAQHERSIRAAG